MTPSTYTPIEVAQMLGVRRETVYRWLAAGVIVGRQLRRTWVIPQAEVDRLTGKQERDAA